MCERELECNLHKEPGWEQSMVRLFNLWMPLGSMALGYCYFMEKVLNIVLVCCWIMTLEGGCWGFQLLAGPKLCTSEILEMRPVMRIRSSNTAEHWCNLLICGIFCWWSVCQKNSLRLNLRIIFNSFCWLFISFCTWYGQLLGIGSVHRSACKGEKILKVNRMSRKCFGDRDQQDHLPLEEGKMKFRERWRNLPEVPQEVSDEAGFWNSYESFN